MTNTTTHAQRTNARQDKIWETAKRERDLAAVWKATHSDYKGTIDGVRCILVLRRGGTTSVPLDDLTDEEIACRLPRKS